MEILLRQKVTVHFFISFIEPYWMAIPCLERIWSRFSVSETVFQERVCVHTQLLSLVLTLRHPMDCSSPGSSVHGIFQAGILEWVAISSSRGSSQPRDRTHVSCISCIGRWILYLWSTWEASRTCSYLGAVCVLRALIFCYLCHT